MTTSSARTPSIVEVRPEVVFLSELLQELTEGKLRIPRFQRPFVWRRDQMTELLDSVYNQYPIGSVLVWETDEAIATLDNIGPFSFPSRPEGAVGYLLDGHQRLSTLAGALIPREASLSTEDRQDPLRWELSWDMAAGRFQHGRADEEPSRLFPLTALFDTLKFFEAADSARSALADRPKVAEEYITKVSQLARSFQHYRVPVIRIRQTGLTQAVEIFARLNSKGQDMSADQMVSALTYRQTGETSGFDLARRIDAVSSQLAEQDFGDVDRTTILRAILANIGEDIYKTDWTRLASSRRAEILTQLEDGVVRTEASLDAAVDFLKGLGVETSRLLPYTMQVAVVSAYFDRFPNPSVEQLEFLARWFWVSSFSGWFGVANPSRVNSLISEIRKSPAGQLVERLENFDMNAMSLPFPSTFDMRSARTRTLLLVMLSLEPQGADGQIIAAPWRPIAEKGPNGVGYVFSDLPRDLLGNPANRMIRPPGAERGSLRGWIDRYLSSADASIIESHGLNLAALHAVRNGDVRTFVSARQEVLIELEHRFQLKTGVRPSETAIGGSPVDTD